MYNTALVGKVAAGSYVVMAVGAFLVVSTGTAYAVPLAGVGGFQVQAEEIRGYGAYIYADVDAANANSSIPVGVAEMQRAEVEGLKIVKTQDAGSVPGISGEMRITITGSGSVETGQQVLKYTELEANRAVLRQQVVDETDADTLRKQFIIAERDQEYDGVTVDVNRRSDKPGLLLRNVSITASYLATDRVSIPEQQIEIAVDSDGDGQYERTIGTVEQRQQ